MTEKEIETIIIGGAVSGLACARKLQENNKKFLLISKDIGGRITTSKDGKINYGAFFITGEYNHMKKWVNKEKRIKLTDLCFHTKNKKYSLFDKDLLPYLPTIIRFIPHLYRFRREYRKFKKNSETMSQKEALNMSPYLSNLYKQKTINYLKQHKFESLIGKYIKEMLYAISFISNEDASAFAFMQWSSQLLLSPIHEFTFNSNAITGGIKNNISIDEVKNIQRKKKKYIVSTKKKKYIAKNIVVATEPWITNKLLNLKEKNTPICSYLFHIKGKTKKPWTNKKEELFDPKSKICVISRQEDGTHLVYSKTKNIQLRKYFKTPRIISKKTWNPALPFPSTLIIDAKQGNNLYITGDYNIGGMEDSFITGIYAANQVISTP